MTYHDLPTYHVWQPPVIDFVNLSPPTHHLRWKMVSSLHIWEGVVMWKENPSNNMRKICLRSSSQSRQWWEKQPILQSLRSVTLSLLSPPLAYLRFLLPCYICHLLLISHPSHLSPMLCSFKLAPCRNTMSGSLFHIKPSSNSAQGFSI